MHNMKRKGKNQTSPLLVQSLYCMTLKLHRKQFFQSNYYQYHQHWFIYDRWRAPEQEEIPRLDMCWLLLSAMTRYNEGMRKSYPKRFAAHLSTKFKTLRDIWCAFNFQVCDPNRELVPTCRPSLSP